MNRISTLLDRLAGRDLAARLLGGGAIALVIKVASAATSYIMLVAFARMLDATSYGQFGFMLNLAIVLAAVASLGLPAGIMRFWGSHEAKGEWGKARGVVAASLKWLGVSAVVLIVAGLTLSALGIGQAQTGLTQGLALTAAFAALLAFGDYYSGALRAQNQTTWAMAPRDIVWRLAAPLLAFVTGLVLGRQDIFIAITCTIIVLLVTTLAQHVIHMRRTRAAVGAAPAELDGAAWRRVALPLWGAGILFAMVQQLDVVVVSAYLGAAPAGAYFAAQKTASLLGLVMIAGGMVAAPLMSARFHTGHMDELQRICRLLAVAIAGTTLAGFVLLAGIGSFLLSIFDPAYVEAYGVMMILAIGFCADALAGPSAYLMQMTKLEWVYLRVMAIVYALVLALQVAFIPRYGMVAAACASAFGVVLWNILSVTLLRREIGIDPSILSLFGRAAPVSKEPK
jgi:O-antigen/teichoic acid export membrane protein